MYLFLLWMRTLEFSGTRSRVSMIPISAILRMLDAFIAYAHLKISFLSSDS